MSKGGGPDEVTQTTSPWAPWIPYGERYLEEVLGEFENGMPGYYPGSTVAPFNPAIGQAQDMLYQLTMGQLGLGPGINPAPYTNPYPSAPEYPSVLPGQPGRGQPAPEPGPVMSPEDPMINRPAPAPTTNTDTYQSWLASIGAPTAANIGYRPGDPRWSEDAMNIASRIAGVDPNDRWALNAAQDQISPFNPDGTPNDRWYTEYRLAQAANQNQPAPAPTPAPAGPRPTPELDQMRGGAIGDVTMNQPTTGKGTGTTIQAGGPGALQNWLSPDNPYRQTGSASLTMGGEGDNYYATDGRTVMYGEPVQDQFGMWRDSQNNRPIGREMAANLGLDTSADIYNSGGHSIMGARGGSPIGNAVQSPNMGIPGGTAGLRGNGQAFEDQQQNPGGFGVNLGMGGYRPSVGGIYGQGETALNYGISQALDQDFNPYLNMANQSAGTAASTINDMMMTGGGLTIPEIGPVSNASAGSFQDTPEARRALNEMLSGQIDNPYLDRYISNVGNQMQTQLDRGLMNRIASGGTQSGQYGSSRQGIAEGIALGDMNRDFGTLASGMYSDQFNRAKDLMAQGVGQQTSRGNAAMNAQTQANIANAANANQRAIQQAQLNAQMQLASNRDRLTAAEMASRNMNNAWNTALTNQTSALGNLGSVTEAPANAISRIGNMGQYNQNYNQSLINADRERYQYGANANRNNVGWLGNSIAPFAGVGGSSTQPVYNNDGGNLLGTALTLGSMFMGGGPFAGFSLGGGTAAPFTGVNLSQLYPSNGGGFGVRF